MKRALLALTFAAVSACSTARTPQAPPATVDVLPAASATYPSPDGRLYATIRHNKKPFSVAIVERGSGKVLGVAESSASLSIGGDRLQGEVHVTYSDDLSTIVIHEDFSDASPDPRYILFQRRHGSAAYRACYFAPPTARIDGPGEFDFIYPNIQRVTSDAITLDYLDPPRTRVIRISDLLQTRTPRSAEGWPSKAYNRYGHNG